MTLSQNEILTRGHDKTGVGLTFNGIYTTRVVDRSRHNHRTSQKEKKTKNDP